MVAMPMCLLIESEKERDGAVRRAKSNIAFYFTTRAYGTFMDFNGWQKEREAIQSILAASGGRSIPSACARRSQTRSWTKLPHRSAEEIRQKAGERYQGIADVLDFYSIHDGADPSDERQRREFDNACRLLDAFEGGQFAS